MAVEDTEKLWEHTVTEELNAPVEKIWELTSDFVNIHKWLPGITSKLASGEPQVSGVVRLVEAPYAYAYEKMLTLNPEDHSQSYLIEENSLKLSNLKAEFRLTEGSQPGTTLVTWGYKMVPDSSTSAEVVAGILGPMYRAGIDSLKVILQEGGLAKEKPALDGSENVTEKAQSDGLEVPAKEVLTGGEESQTDGLEKVKADEKQVLTSEVENLSIATESS